MTHPLHEEALKRVKAYNESTTRLLDILEQIQESKIYLNLGYASLWSYVTMGLNLSESQAHQFISVMRKVKEVPKLKEAIQRGEISLPKAALIAPALKSSNQQDWLEKAKLLTTREIKEELVKASPTPKIPEKLTPRASNLLELRLGISQELMGLLKRAQDLASQKNRKPLTLVQTLDAVLSDYIERVAPENKAKRARIVADKSLCSAKVGEANKSPQETIPSSKRNPKNISTNYNSRIPIPAFLKHQIQRKAHGQCQYTLPNGHRCHERRFVEFHHLIPLSRGGTHALENLTLFCSGHHKASHRLISSRFKN